MLLSWPICTQVFDDSFQKPIATCFKWYKVPSSNNTSSLWYNFFETMICYHVNYLLSWSHTWRKVPFTSMTHISQSATNINVNIMHIVASFVASLWIKELSLCSSSFWLYPCAVNMPCKVSSALLYGLYSNFFCSLWNLTFLTSFYHSFVFLSFLLPSYTIRFINCNYLFHHK